MATESTKYKFGSNDLDFLDYIINLENNVHSYVEDKVKRGKWTQDLADEFGNSFNKYITAFKKSNDDGDNRFTTDALGTIIDSHNEFGAEDDLDFYYNDKGERLDRADFDKLRKRKQKHYKGFAANREVATFFHRIGNAMAKHKSETKVDKYDKSKHGWINWWGTVKNLDGGNNLKPYLDLDPYDETTKKRSRTNRATKAANFIGEYRNWLKNRNLNYDDHSLGSFDELDKRLESLQEKWGDGNWDNDDLIYAQLAGIDQNWLKGFFSEEQNPFKSLAEKDKDKTAEEKAKQELEDKDFDDWFNGHWNNYVNNSGNYNDDNEYYFGQLPEQTLEQIRESFSDPNINLNNYINLYLTTNPFNNQDPRALNILIQSGYALSLKDGSYYIPQINDERNGMGLIYNPNTGRMKYTFIGNIKPVWNKMKEKRDVERGVKKRSSLYRKDGGTIETFQIGGNFDFDVFMKQDRQAGIKDRANKNNRTETQQEAGERYINEDHKSMQNPDAGFTGVELTRLAAIGGDITSMIIGFAGGNVASTAVGAASTTANLLADIADDSTSAWETFKNAAFGYGMDVVGAIPVFGATGKMAKMAKNAIKLAPKAMMILGASSAITNAPQYYESWKKLLDTDGKVTVDDWRNIAASIQLIAGSTAAVARQKAVKNAAKTDSVAMDFVDANGNKQTRIFTGNDAKAIRDAEGNLDALKQATTGKFEDIKDLQLDITGNREGFSIFGKKFGASEGTTSVYNVFNGRNGRYIERGQHWYSLTPDERTLGIKGPGLTIADAAAAKTAALDAEILAQLNPAINQSRSVENSLARRNTKINDLNSKISLELASLDALNSAYTGRTTSDIDVDLARIRQAHNSGEYATRQTAHNKRKNSLIFDEVDSSGNVTNPGKITKALLENYKQQRDINSELKLKNNDLKNATRKKDKERILKEIDILTERRTELETNALKIKEIEARYKADEQYLKDNDLALELTLNSERSTAEAYESSRDKSVSTIDKLKTRLAAWLQLNDPNFKTAARRKLEATVDANGNIEFTLASGDKVTRNWQELLTKYGIKYKQGGILKFDGGGKSQKIFKESDDITTSKTSPTPKQKTEFDVARNYMFGRSWFANKMNRDIIDTANKIAGIVDLRTPFEIDTSVIGNSSPEIEGRLSAAKMMNIVSAPVSSDGALNRAVQLDAAAKAQEFINNGKRLVDDATRAAIETAKQAEIANAKSRYETAFANNQAFNRSKIAKLQNEMAYQNKKYTNTDLLLQEMQMYALKKFNTDKAYTDYFARKDISDDVKYNLSEYAEGLTPEMLDAWNAVNSGAKTADNLTDVEQNNYLSAAKEAQRIKNDKLRSYYGIPRYSIYQRPTSDVSQFRETLTFRKKEKKGGKIDDFHKNSQKHIDRSEKAIERIYKSRKKRK